MSKKRSTSSSNQPELIKAPRLHWALRVCLWAMGLVGAGLLSILMVVGVAMVMAYPQLPDTSDMADYRPKLPLRIFTADGAVIGEKIVTYTSTQEEWEDESGLMDEASYFFY
jgi:penicillin-binding protein 1A